MRRFHLQVTIFLVLQGAILSAVVARCDIDRESVFGAALDKHERLRRTPPPRLILVGGSNVAMGVDSPMLERHVGLPVVNLGLHAALGAEFMLNEARGVARQGDVVVVSLEYEHFCERLVRASVLLSLLQVRPSSARYLGPQSFATLSDDLLGYLGRTVRVELAGGAPPMEWPYRRRAFNELGDIVGHYGSGPGFRREEQPIRGLCAEGRPTVRWLNAAARWGREHGVTFFLSWPPTTRERLAHHAPAAERLVRELGASLAMPILGTPFDMALPREQFYDTDYHPTPMGIVRRTALLANFLSALRRGEPVGAPALTGPLGPP